MIGARECAGDPVEPVHRFMTTPWTLVFRAGDGTGPKTGEALEALCRRYWNPVYAFALTRGLGVHDAQDLTQAFFEHFLEKGYFRAADPSRGRFRSFLLTAFRHFANKQWNREHRLKRGGKAERVWLETLLPEDETAETRQGTSPTVEFDRQWGMAVMAAALAAVAQEYEEQGRGIWFSELKGFLSAHAADGEYATIAARMGVASGAVAVAVHRLRQRFADRVRSEVEQTVARTCDVEDELRYLVGLVSGR